MVPGKHSNSEKTCEESQNEPKKAAAVAQQKPTSKQTTASKPAAPQKGPSKKRQDSAKKKTFSKLPDILKCQKKYLIEKKRDELLWTNKKLREYENTEKKSQKNMSMLLDEKSNPKNKVRREFSNYLLKRKQSVTRKEPTRKNTAKKKSTPGKELVDTRKGASSRCASRSASRAKAQNRPSFRPSRMKHARSMIPYPADKYGHGRRYLSHLYKAVRTPAKGLKHVTSLFKSPDQRISHGRANDNCAKEIAYIHNNRTVVDNLDTGHESMGHDLNRTFTCISSTPLVVVQKSPCDPLLDSGFIQYAYTESPANNMMQCGNVNDVKHTPIPDKPERESSLKNDNVYSISHTAIDTLDNEPAKGKYPHPSLTHNKNAEPRKVKIPKISFKNIPLKEQSRPLWNQNVPAPKPKPNVEYPKDNKCHKLKKEQGREMKDIHIIHEESHENGVDHDFNVSSLAHMSGCYDIGFDNEDEKTEDEEQISEIEVVQDGVVLAGDTTQDKDPCSHPLASDVANDLHSPAGRLLQNENEGMAWPDGSVIERTTTKSPDNRKLREVKVTDIRERRSPESYSSVAKHYPSVVKSLANLPYSYNTKEDIGVQWEQMSRASSTLTSHSKANEDSSIGEEIDIDEYIDQIMRDVTDEDTSEVESTQSPVIICSQAKSSPTKSITVSHVSDYAVRLTPVESDRVCSHVDPRSESVLSESYIQIHALLDDNLNGPDVDIFSRRTKSPAAGDHGHVTESNQDTTLSSILDLLAPTQRSTPVASVSSSSKKSTVTPSNVKNTNSYGQRVYPPANIKHNEFNESANKHGMENVGCFQVSLSNVGKIKEMLSMTNNITDPDMTEEYHKCAKQEPGTTNETRSAKKKDVEDEKSLQFPIPKMFAVLPPVVGSDSGQLTPRRHRLETSSQFAMRAKKTAALRSLEHRDQTEDTVIEIPSAPGIYSTPKLHVRKRTTADAATQADSSEKQGASSSNYTRPPTRSATSLSFAKSLSYSFNKGSSGRKQSGFNSPMLPTISQELTEEQPGNLRDLFLEDDMEMGVVRRNGGQRRTTKCCHNLRKTIRRWYSEHKNSHHEDVLFKKQIKNVEGQFGCGIVSFFTFLRWVILLNVILAFIWLLFVVLPQVLHFDYSFMTDQFYIKNIIDGENALSHSWMFYGNYGKYAGNYHLAMVYLLAILATYFGGLFVILSSIAHATHDEGRNAKDTHYTMSILLFSSWDYSLTDKQATRNLSSGIVNTVRDMMYEFKVKRELSSWTRRDWCRVIAWRILAWFITLLLIGGGCTAIFLFISSDMVSILAKVGYEADEETPLVVYGPTIVFMAINAFVPMGIYKLPKIERYIKGGVELNISVGRVFMLRLANLGALVTSLYQKVHTGTEQKCVGTLIGQELYKLVILDTLIQLPARLIPKFAKYYWAGKKSDFVMPPTVLAIVYRQALIWVGAMVCPVLPLVGIVSMTIFFWTNYMVVTRTCHPPTKRVNHGKRSTFFMGLMAATLVLLIVPVSMVISSTFLVGLMAVTLAAHRTRTHSHLQDIINLGEMGSDADTFCGPFGNDTMLSVLTDFRDSLKDSQPAVASILTLLGSSMFLIPLILVMISLLYFQQLRLTWEKRKKKILSVELAKERDENKYLMKQLHLLADN